jgi:hypothetical protein
MVISPMPQPAAGGTPVLQDPHPHRIRQRLLTIASAVHTARALTQAAAGKSFGRGAGLTG